MFTLWIMQISLDRRCGWEYAVAMTVAKVEQCFNNTTSAIEIVS